MAKLMFFLKAAFIIGVAYLLLIGLPNLFKGTSTQSQSQSDLRPTVQSNNGLFPSDVRPSPDATCQVIQRKDDSSSLENCSNRYWLLAITLTGGSDVSCMKTTASNATPIPIQAEPFLGGLVYNCLLANDWTTVRAKWYASDGTQQTVEYSKP